MSLKNLIFVYSLLLAALALPIHASRYALLIGCNDGGTSLSPLHYAETDARHFADLLTKHGGFDESAVTTLLHPDSAVLSAKLRKVKAMLASHKSPENDLFLFYFSGHADGRDLLLGTSRFPLAGVQSFLDSLPSGMRIGIFDACQSGAITEFKGGRRAEPFYLADSQKIKGQVIIASAAANERAQESPSLKGSIFTFYWLSGLRGSADASGDGRVTLDEAYRYAYRKTVETSTLSLGEAQHPMYRFSIRGEGDIMLTDLSKASGGIVFDRTCEGKFLVLSDTYTDIFADFFKKKGGEWFVSLDPGSYTAINARGTEVGIYKFTLGNGNLRIAQSMLAPTLLSGSAIKGAAPQARPADAAVLAAPVSIYSGGAGIGFLPHIKAAPGAASQALSLSIANLWWIQEHVNLFVDGYYLTAAAATLNLGSAIGFDYVQRSSFADRFIGAGAGMFYFRKNGPALSDALAPALTFHIGYGLNLDKRIQLVAQIPALVTFSRGVGATLGFELKILFSGRFKDLKLEK